MYNKRKFNRLPGDSLSSSVNTLLLPSLTLKTHCVFHSLSLLIHFPMMSYQYRSYSKGNVVVVEACSIMCRTHHYFPVTQEKS